MKGETQRQRILNSKAKEFKVAGTSYKGANPVYKQLRDSAGVVSFKKVTPGIPFVRT